MKLDSSYFWGRNGRACAGLAFHGVSWRPSCLLPCPLRVHAWSLCICGRFSHGRQMAARQLCPPPVRQHPSRPGRSRWPLNREAVRRGISRWGPWLCPAARTEGSVSRASPGWTQPPTRAEQGLQLRKAIACRTDRGTDPYERRQMHVGGVGNEKRQGQARRGGPNGPPV